MKTQKGPSTSFPITFSSCTVLKLGDVTGPEVRSAARGVSGQSGFTKRGHPGGGRVLELEGQQLVAWSWPGVHKRHKALGQTEAQKEVPGRTVRSRFPEQGPYQQTRGGTGERNTGLGTDSRVRTRSWIADKFPGYADAAGPESTH